MEDYPVAVLISVYQKDELNQVTAAINSIRNQDYGSEKIHIYLGVDGPLPLELDEYIQNHSSLFHRIVRNTTNQGLAATLNRLIESLGDERYAFRMDADDIALSYRFRLQIEFMESNPHVDICGGSIVEFDESGNAVMVRNYPQNTQLAKKYICKASPLAHMTVCFRTSLFRDEKHRYPRVKSSQDIRLWSQVIASGNEIANLTLPLVLVRMNESMLKRRSVTYGLREFDAFLMATYSLHGLNWKLVYPFARLATRLTPSWINRIIYRKFRYLLNTSKKKKTISSKSISCTDTPSKFDGDSVERRVLFELYGFSENQIDKILPKEKKSRTKAA